MRMFDTGATRDTDEGKLDFEAFLSPKVLRAYAEYMDSCRVQADGTLRTGDNWQKGIPRDVLMKSMWRHFMAVWEAHRGVGDHDCFDEVEDLCALLFNVMAYLHSMLA